MSGQSDTLSREHDLWSQLAILSAFNIYCTSMSHSGSLTNTSHPGDPFIPPTVFLFSWPWSNAPTPFVIICGATNRSSRCLYGTDRCTHYHHYHHYHSTWYHNYRLLHSNTYPAYFQPPGYPTTTWPSVLPNLLFRACHITSVCPVSKETSGQSTVGSVHRNARALGRQYSPGTST